MGKTLNPETKSVEQYGTTIDGIEVNVWDSPGLQDGTSNEKVYLRDIKEKCTGKIDLLLYCMSMKNERLVTGSVDIDAMCKLTETLGKIIWENAVIVLTHANTRIDYIRDEMDDEGDNDELKIKFTKKSDLWRSQITECLKKDVGLSTEVIETLPICTAGIKEEPCLIEDLSPWLSTLWMESLIATKRQAQPALIKMNLRRLRKRSEILNEEEFDELLKKENIIIMDKATEIESGEAGQTVGMDICRSAGAAHRIDRMTNLLCYIMTDVIIYALS